MCRPCKTNVPINTQFWYAWGNQSGLFTTACSDKAFLSVNECNQYHDKIMYDGSLVNSKWWQFSCTTTTSCPWGIITNKGLQPLTLHKIPFFQVIADFIYSFAHIPFSNLATPIPSQLMALPSITAKTSFTMASNFS